MLLVLRSILSDINIAPQFSFGEYLLSIHFTFNVFMPLNFKWVSYKQYIVGLGPRPKNRCVIFCLLNIRNLVLLEGNLPLCESVRGRTSFSLQCLEIPNIPSSTLWWLSPGAWLSLDQSDAPARVWNIEWHKDDTIYNSGMAEAAVSNDGSSSAQQQQCPIVVVSSADSALTRLFLCWPWLWFPMPGLCWLLLVL